MKNIELKIVSIFVVAILIGGVAGMLLNPNWGKYPKYNDDEK